jgi:DNA-binding FadR family transcriptional regulator
VEIADMESPEVTNDGGSTRTAKSIVSSDSFPIRPAKASDLIADALRRLILRDGDVGAFLPSERLLSERFQVSRPTLREALRILESEGLVEIRRGVRGGAVIKEPTIEEFAKRFGFFLQVKRATGGDIFRLRCIVEPAAARLAAERPQEARVVLEDVLAQERALVDEEETEPNTVSRLLLLHDAVLRLSHNVAVEAMGRLLDTILRRYTEQTLPMASARYGSRSVALWKSYTAHQRIAQAIIHGDPVAAERLMLEHLGAIRHLNEGPIEVHKPDRWPRQVVNGGRQSGLESSADA